MTGAAPRLRPVGARRRRLAQAGEGRGVAMNEPIRIGVLGCGRIGRWHAELIAKRIPGLALSRVFDVRRESADEVADVLGVAVADDPGGAHRGRRRRRHRHLLVHRHPRGPARGGLGGRQAHLLREAPVARPGRGGPGVGGRGRGRGPPPGRLQPPLRPEPPRGARAGRRRATSASCTWCASPAAIRRLLPSPTSRCRAGSSAT